MKIIIIWLIIMASLIIVTKASAGEVKPIEVQSWMKRGYLFKNYTLCGKEWYPKGYRCKCK